MCKLFTQKTKVVCDTNVWYNLSKDGYVKFGDVLSNYQLVLTNLSLTELFSTEKIKLDSSAFLRVKEAFEAIRKYAIFQSDNDIEHIMKVLNIDFVDENTFDKQERYDYIVNDFLNANEYTDLTYNWDWHIDQRAKSNDFHCDVINQQIEQWRKEKKQNPISLTEIRDCLIWLIKKDIYDYLLRHQIKINNIPFATNQVDQIISGSLDLYLTAYSNFIYEKYQQPGSKVKPNDYADFRNLVYCNNGHKYFTFENTQKQGVGKMLDLYCKSWLIPEADVLRQRNQAISHSIINTLNP